VSKKKFLCVNKGSSPDELRAKLQQIAERTGASFFTDSSWLGSMLYKLKWYNSEDIPEGVMQELYPYLTSDSWATYKARTWGGPIPAFRVRVR
jgi:hypothetical protein